uniref:Uncharacterized protein n=1 Tax=Aegilops tauschii subsp. strangulata TaxID=200361 RepID=A0A453LEG6_AEGTS
MAEVRGWQDESVRHAGGHVDVYHGIDTFHSTDTAYQREALDTLFLLDMDMKVKAIIKLINEDVDSFGRRAEMYQNIFFRWERSRQISRSSKVDCRDQHGK